jgi:tRNA U55 pseudouridine synthase TruB
LGAVLGVGGSLASLVRTRSCGFELADSLELAAILDGAEPVLIDGKQALAHLPTLTLAKALQWRWSNGQKLPGDWLTLAGLPPLEPPPIECGATEEPEPIESEPLRLLTEEGDLLGVATVRSTETELLLIPKLVLPPTVERR